MEVKMSRRVDPNSFLNGGNAAFIFDLYQQFRTHPENIDPSWRQFFNDLGEEAQNLFADDDRPPVWMEKQQRSLGDTVPASLIAEQVRDAIRVVMMIRAYRVRGHLAATLDPLNLKPADNPQELTIEAYGLTAKDLPKRVQIDNALGLENPTIGEVLAKLRQIYCGNVGIEFMHILDPGQKSWIRDRVENTPVSQRVDQDDRHEILKNLAAAELFEKFLNVKYPGAKRFGLEGGDSLIPALQAMVHRCSDQGVEKIVFGMAHRGRLSVLANVIGKPCHEIFAHFQAGDVDPASVQGAGDVKYHLGYSNVKMVNGRPLHMTLMPNPSHLEAVNPVVLGKVRAEQHMNEDEGRRRFLSVLMHGDAAFIGQGLVAETFGMAALKGYCTGGTIHVVVNNQIGFTTSPEHSRSSPYSSDLAKVIQAPVFHVNGDDPEAVVWVMRLAVDFQRQFAQDVVVDLVCYRRHGHNEIDEPSFTQPLMYKKISQHPSPFKLYSTKLLAQDVVTENDVKSIIDNYDGMLRPEFDGLSSERTMEVLSDTPWLEENWQGISAPLNHDSEGDMCPLTGVDAQTLSKISKAIAHMPEGLTLNPRLERLVKAKQEVLDAGSGIDWGTAEALAFGSLLLEGKGVRLSGQDVGRGTFSHRHAVWVDQTTEQRYVPLNNIEDKQACIEIVDSPLAEASVLGFEYGYSLADPHHLVLWEAQFGDFANGAQVMVDQFISSAEYKWQRLSGLVMLLPHGFEGQGPEHSSSRLERYLQLCAENNMRVVNCSTPANYFHILRRQLVSQTRKPLVVITPKSLLRHKLAVSELRDMEQGTHFCPVFPDFEVGPEQAKRVILCSGKIYYELYQARKEMGIVDVAILRLEQYYPLPRSFLIDRLKAYHKAHFVWCQEEPANMGAWTFLDRRLENVLAEIKSPQRHFHYIGRPEAASPATGNAKRHELEQRAIIEQSLLFMSSMS